MEIIPLKLGEGKSFLYDGLLNLYEGKVLKKEEEAEFLGHLSNLLRENEEEVGFNEKIILLSFFCGNLQLPGYDVDSC